MTVSQGSPARREAASPFTGPGKTRALGREFNWAATPLGPVGDWPQSLRTAVDLCMGSAFPAFLWWGPSLLQVYNDAALEIVRATRPDSFGVPAEHAWADVWEAIGPLARQAVATGEAFHGAEFPVVLDRDGSPETGWFSFAYAAVRDEAGSVAGLFITVMETTARLRAERRMRESEASYRRLYDSIDEGFCVIEVLLDAVGNAADYRFLETNPAFVQQTGLTDAVGRRMRELAPAHESHWFEIYGRVALTGEPTRFEARAEALGRWYDVYAFRFGDPAQRRVAVLFKDVGERKRAEAALRESEARYRALATASADVVYRMSPDWREMRQLDGRGFLSDMMEPNEAWLGRYIHPDDHTRVTAAAAEAVRTRSTFALEHRVMRADGTTGWTLSRAVPLRDAAGEIVEWVGTASDVTRRKEAELAVQASEARLGQELSRAELVHRLSARLVSEEQPETLHQEILDGAMALMQADAASLQLLEPDGPRLRLLASRNLHPDSRAYWAFVDPHHASTCGQSFQSDGRIVVEDVEANALIAGTPDLQEYRRSGLRSVQTTPLVARSGRRIGLISTHWREPRRFDERDFRYFDILARQLADLMDRSQLGAALRSSEERQAYLLALSDALRPLADPTAIQGVAARLLGEWLGADRTLYADTEGDTIVVNRDWVRGVASMAGRYPASVWGAYTAVYLRGEPYVVHDVTSDPRIDDAAIAAYRGVEVAAFIGVGLVKGGAHVASFGAHSRTPRAWTAEEVELVRETAERTWAACERASTEAALRASETRYRMIVEGARDYAIITTDARGLITSWSPGAEATFGWTEAEAVGQSFALTFGADDRATGEPERDLARAAERGVTPDVRWHQPRKGARVFLDGTTRALRDESGRLTGFLMVGQDVTFRRALDDAFRASEARYRALVENVHDYAIFLLDAQGIITEWPKGAQRVKGYSADEAIGQHLSLFYPPDDLAAGEPIRELAEAAATGRAEREGWRVCKGGTRFWANEIATAVRDRDGHLVGFTKISRDLTEQRQAEEAAEIVRAAGERNILRRRLAEAEEDERRRLSRELHDEAGQHLTALALGLQAISDHSPAGSEVDRRATELRALADTLGRDLHAVAVRLRPRALDDFGLEAALAAFTEEWSRRGGIAIDVHMRMVTERLPDDVESALYRIVQEALTNVSRHSAATRASVLIERRDGHVVAVVEDDGRGFSSDGDLASPREGPGLGLIGMRERAALLGGSLELESTPGGGGTTLFVRIPVVAPAGGTIAVH